MLPCVRDSLIRHAQIVHRQVGARTVGRRVGELATQDTNDAGGRSNERTIERSFEWADAKTGTTLRHIHANRKRYKKQEIPLLSFGI